MIADTKIGIESKLKNSKIKIIRFARINNLYLLNFSLPSAILILFTV